MNTDKFPLVMPALGFMSGIFVQTYFPIHSQSILWALIAGIAFVLVISDKSVFKISRRMEAQAFLVMALFFSLGMMRISLEERPTFSWPDEQAMSISGTILEISDTEKSQKLWVYAESFGTSQQMATLNKEVWIYVPDSLSDLHAFDHIHAEVHVFKDTKPNPYAFDMAQYRAQEGILFTAYSSKIEVGAPGAFPWKYWPQKIRTKLSMRLDKIVDSSKTRALIKAMLLGDKGGLDADTRKVFSNTGAIHVLAVSGLHVGILASLVFALMTFFRLKKAILPVTAIVCLAYALITGASPSVVRASILLALFLMGRHFKAYTNGFNLLAFVAIIMLVVKPGDLFSISFQFSFMAILGLLLFGERINALIKSKYWLVNYSWGLISAALAVQLCLTPMMLYYFSRFPTYFLFSGFVAIPMAFLAVAGGIAGLVISIFSITWAGLLMDGLAWVLSGMYGGLEWLDHLPFAVWEGIFVSLPGLVCLTGCILALYAFFIRKNKLYLYVAQMALILLIVDEFYHFSSVGRQQEILAYHMRQGFLIDRFFQNLRITYVSDGLNESAEQLAAGKYRLVKRSKPVQRNELTSSQTICVSEQGFRWCVVGNDFPEDAGKANLLFLRPDASPQIVPSSNAILVFLNRYPRKKKEDLRKKFPKNTFHDMDTQSFFHLKLADSVQ